MANKDAVRAAQLVLRQTNPRLSADGGWGRLTQAAYDASSQRVRNGVDGVLSSFDLDVSDVYEEMSVSVSAADLITVEQASTYIRAVAEEFGLGRFADAFVRLLELENPLVSGKFYDPKARNRAGYAGLAQADPRGRFWAEAQEVDPLLGDFTSSWSDWKQSIRAIVAYQKRYLPILQASFPSKVLDGDTMYLIHNQGPTGARRILEGETKGQYANQSVSARKLIDANFGRFA